LPFAGIAIAIDCVTATKGWSRLKIAVHGLWRERRLPDRKTVVRLPRSVRQLIAESGSRKVQMQLAPKPDSEKSPAPA
jgi:hypothetical protein